MEIHYHGSSSLSRGIFKPGKPSLAGGTAQFEDPRGHDRGTKQLQPRSFCPWHEKLVRLCSILKTEMMITSFISSHLTE
jgi:hypothetical protein